MCNEIDFVLTSDPSASGYDSCTCADGSEDWKTSGCCIASGEYNGIDLTASGCLYPVNGVVGPNYLGKDSSSSSGKPTVDVGKAVESWASQEKSSKRSQFMCPADGILLPEHKVIGQYEEYDGNTKHAAFHHTGSERMRQGDSTSPNATVHTTTVSGASTKVFPGTGKRSFHFNLPS